MTHNPNTDEERAARSGGRRPVPRYEGKPADARSIPEPWQFCPECGDALEPADVDLHVCSHVAGN